MGRILFLLALGLLGPFNILAQHQTKKVKINNEALQGDIEVCTNCTSIKADPSKVYKWYKEGEIKESKGGFQGELLHGKAELYHQEDSEKTMISSGNYFTGLKDGKNMEYAFGQLETIEYFQKGELQSIEFYEPENGHLDRKIEYLSTVSPRRVRTNYYYNTTISGQKLGTHLEIEGYQVLNGNSFSTIYDGKYKKAFITGDQEVTKEEGVYQKNRRHGNWRIYYANNVIAELKYDNDLLTEEKFTQQGQLFTGKVEYPSASGKSVLQSIEVKNGIREGKTLEAFITDPSTNALKATREIEYAAGTPTQDQFNFNKFLKNQEITSQKELCKECDSKGSGLLFIDRIQYTPQGALVYFQTINNVFISGSRIMTQPVGHPKAFTAIDLNTKKIFKASGIYNLAIAPAYQPSYYGEMHSFILYFEGLGPTSTKVSFIEGNPENPFEIDEKTGNTLYNWGCYDLTLR